MLLNVHGKRKKIDATSESKIIIIPEVKVPEELKVAAEAGMLVTGKTWAKIVKIVDLMTELEGTVFIIIGKVVEIIISWIAWI